MKFCFLASTLFGLATLKHSYAVNWRPLNTTESSNLQGHRDLGLGTDWATIRNGMFGNLRYLEPGECKNGAKIDMSTANIDSSKGVFRDSQLWKYKDGFIRNKGCANFVLDVAGFKCTNGAKIHLWTKKNSNNANQKWDRTYVYDVDGKDHVADYYEHGKAAIFNVRHCKPGIMQLDRDWTYPRLPHLWKRNDDLWPDLLEGGVPSGHDYNQRESSVWSWGNPNDLNPDDH